MTARLMHGKGDHKSAILRCDDDAAYRLLCLLTPGAAATGHLERVIRMLQHEGIAYEHWFGTPYSSDAHLEVRSLLTKAAVSSSRCTLALWAA
jgi:hypothetical protein